VKIGQAQFDKLAQMLADFCPPGMLRLVDIEIFLGPNPHADFAALRGLIETSRALPPKRRVLDRLHQDFPRLFPHSGGDKSDGPCDAATVAALIAKLAGALLTEKITVDFRFDSSAEDGSRASFLIEFLTHTSSLQAAATALILIGERLAVPEAAGEAIGTYMPLLDKACAQCRPNNESSALIAAARRQDLPYLQIGQDIALWQIGWGVRSEQYWVSASNVDGVVARRLSFNKATTKQLCRQLGLPTPNWRLLDAADELPRVASTIGWPCVVKPADRGGGVGVSADIRDIATLERAVSLARGHSRRVLIEAHEPGDDYRLMVVDGRLAMAIRLDPPHIIGDGERTVGELVAALNDAREGGETYLLPVPVDDMMLTTLNSQAVDLATILPEGKAVKLRTNSNHATGGTITDVIDTVHPQVRRLAEQLTAAMGFRVAGIDYVTRDIRRSHDEVGGGIIEVNTTAGFEVVIKAQIVPETLAEVVIGDRPGRVPVALLIAPSESQAEIGDVLRDRLPRGWAAAGDWARMGPIDLPASKLDHFGRAQALLRYPGVERLLLLWNLDSLYEFGLPADSLARTVILGEAPKADWLGLLERRSARLDRVGVAAEAAAMLLEAGE
jgi:cyanophycin synthetase